MTTIILLQLFWLSFALIGLAGSLLLGWWGRTKQCMFLRFMHAAHPTLQAVLLFVCGLVPFIPVVVTSYVLQWPLAVLTIFYAA